MRQRERHLHLLSGAWSNSLLGTGEAATPAAANNVSAEPSSCLRAMAGYSECIQ